MRLRTKVAWVMALIVLTAAFPFGAILYRMQSKALTDGIDAKLLATAHLARAILPVDYHDRIRDANSVSTSEYLEIVDRWNQLCIELKLEYIWSLVVVDGEIVFTSGSSTSKDVTKGDHALFFEPHSSPGQYEAVFTSMEPQFQVTDDKWGRIRAVLVPFQDAQQRPYLFGASMTMADVDALTRKTLWRSLGISVAVLAFGIFLALLLARSIARPLENLTEVARHIADGRYEHHVEVGGARELEVLARSVGSMSRAIQEKIAELRTSNDDLHAEITERKRAEEALRDSEERHRVLYESSRDAIMTLAPPSWTFTAGNPATVALFGVEDETELVRLSPWDLSPETQPDGRASAEKGREIIEMAMREGAHFFEWTHEPRGGPPFPATVLLTRIDLGGQSFLQSTVRDMSREIELEEQLRHAEKMRAVGQLAGGVAHDFNNLLQAILGYSEMALEEVEPGSTIHEDLGEVMNAANRATTLVGQLLAFSRRQVLELDNLALDEVIRDFAKMVERVIGEDVALNICSVPGLGIVRADRGQMEQMLMNLCVNARDAMPDGGEIAIGTENADLDATYCEEHVWAEPGRHAVLSVTDTGCGMDAETQEHIFEPFFTTKEGDKGTGLGLSTVYGIVRQHNGMIQVYSETGVGTTFRVYLPVVEGSKAADRVRAPRAPSGGREAILLAEDNDAVRSLAEELLARAGYRVLTAEDGEEAIRVFDENAGEIDLAVLDVVMPKLGGRAVFNHIRQKRPGSRVLFASGYSRDAGHTNFVLDEGVQLIQKPYQRDTLLRKVREVLDS